MSRCPDVRTVPTWTRPHGAQESIPGPSHYTHAPAGASYDRESSLAVYSSSPYFTDVQFALIN